MRRILFGTLTVASIALGAAGAMAQAQPTPVPGGSGSQVTNPSTYRNTATQGRERSMMMQQRKMGMTTGSVGKRHVKKTHKTMHHSS
jgi:hypothetical protein